MVWLAVRNLQALDPIRRWVAVGLRVLVITLLTFMLAGLHTVRTHDRLTVVAVVDQSESVRRYAPQATTQAGAIDRFLLQAGQDIKPDDRFIYLAYDGKPQIASRATAQMVFDRGTIKRAVDGTNTAAAIRQAIAAKADTHSALRLVIATDGNDTHGDTLTAIEEAIAAGIQVDLIPIRYARKREVMVESVNARLEAVEGQTIRVAAQLRATRPTEGTFELFHDRQAAGAPVKVTAADWTLERGRPPKATTEQTSPQEDSPPERAFAGATGAWVAQLAVDVPLGLGSAGRHRFEGQFTPAGGDEDDGLASNNKAEAVTLVRGQGKILVVDNVGGEAGRVLAQRLQEQGIVVETLPAEAIADSLGQLHAYDAVVLQNVPADRVTGSQQQAIADYVKQLGGGLVMIGGPKSFGAGAWTNTVIDQILPVTCQLPSQRVLPSGALMLVIDRSGSMGDVSDPTSKQRMANESAILAARTLYEDDLIGVIAFDGAHETIVELQRNTNPLAIEGKIARIGSGGGTNIQPGLTEAVDKLSSQDVADTAIRHIILVTDGEDGTVINNYANLLRKMESNGVTLSTIAIGSGANTGLLSQLATYGGGAFHEVDDPTKLRQVFIKEAQTIRKNLIREQAFEPVLEVTNSPVTTGMSGFPALEGLVLTGAREDPSVQMPLTDPEGNPVFAHWQVGLGRSAAFTADATTRWGTHWVDWTGYSDFWSRMMRYVARPTESRGYDLQTRIEGDELVIKLDTAGSEDAGSALNVQGAIINPNDDAQTVSLTPTGPGMYETRVPITEDGHYLVSLNMKTPSGQRRRVFAGATQPKGRELANLTSNDGLLKQLSETINGRVFELNEMISAGGSSSEGPSSGGGLFERSGDIETRSMLPAWHKLMPWLLGLLMLDIACRRIAWNGTEIVQTLRNPRKMAAVQTSMAGALVSAKQMATPDRKQVNKKATPRRAAKTFKASDDVAATAETTKPKQPPKAEANHTNTEEASATSRLMAAKRRAREQFDE